MNFRQVVMELPNTVAGHRFFVAEHSGIDSASAAQECEKAPKEGVFMEDDWMALAVPSAQLSVVGARVGLARIVARWEKGSMPSLDEVPAAEAQLRQILYSVGEYAQKLSAGSLASRLVVEVPASMLQVPERQLIAVDRKQTRGARTRQLALLVALLGLLALGLMFLPISGWRAFQSIENPPLGNASPKNSTIESKPVDEPALPLSPPPSSADVVVHIPTEYRVPETAVPDAARQAKAPSTLRNSCLFSRQEKQKFDKQYPENADTPPDSPAGEPRKLAILPESFSIANLNKHFSAFKAELSTEESIVADFAEFTANVFLVCSYNLMSVEKLEYDKGYLDEIDKQAKDLLQLVNQIEELRSGMQLPNAKLLEQLKRHGINLGETTERAEAVRSLIRNAQAINPKLVVKLANSESDSDLEKLKVKSIYVRGADGEKIDEIATALELKPGQTMTLQLSASSFQFWCKPIEEIELVDVKFIYQTKSSEPFQVPGLQNPMKSKSSGKPKKLSIRIQHNYGSWKSKAVNMDIIIEVTGLIEPILIKSHE